MNDSIYPDLFDAHRRALPASRPLLAGTAALSYGELLDRSEKLPRLLLDRGVAVGDRLVIASRHEKEVASLFLALLRCGVTSVILDPDAGPAVLANLIGASRAKGAFIDTELAASLCDFDRLGIWKVEIEPQREKRLFERFLGRAAPQQDGRLPGLWDALPRTPWPDQRVPADTTAVVMFTSGSTSRPKGVELSHRNLAAHMGTMVRHYPFDGTTRLLNPIPLHHVDGIFHGLLAMFTCGGTLQREGRFAVQKLAGFLEAIYLHRVTHLYAVPTVLALIHRLGGEHRDAFSTPDFKFVISGAGHLDASLWRSFEADFSTRVVNVYGLTETVSQSLFCGPDDATRRVGTLGKPVDCRLRVVNADGAEAAAGTPGEIWLAGDHIMKGYLADPDATAEVLADGWLRTGDLGSVDADGFVHFVGRKKDVIKRGGVSVYPQDVTHALLQLPGVAEAVTIGCDDATWEQRVVACVVPAAGAALTPEGLRQALEKQVARETLPDEVHVLDALPRGPAGKVLVPELRARLAAPAAARPAAGDVDRAVFDLAARCFGVPVESLDASSSPQTTSGWDSLAHMNLVAALEETFGIRLEAYDILELETLGTAVTIVNARRLAQAPAGAAEAPACARR